MNNSAQQFFNAYKQKHHLQEPIKVSAWQFGAQPDELAGLVVQGKKTGTCSLYKLYEIDNEPLPEVGQYDVILDSQDQPVVITRTTNVDIQPMNEVPVEFALSEGEGDGTYEYWWKEHVDFFTKEVKDYDMTFSTNDLLVCETFEVVQLNEEWQVSVNED